MANKPVNRYEVQLLIGSGYIRVQSRKGGCDSPREVIASLRRFCDEFEPAVNDLPADSPTPKETE